VGRLYSASASFTRPSNTTAYAAGDLVANNATAGSVTPMTLSWPNGQNFAARNITLKKTKVDLTNASFNVWFFGASPTVTNGDNGAFAGDFLSSILFEPVRVDFAATATGAGVIGTSLFGDNLLILPATCYALLEALGAYTPASAEVFTLDVRGTSI
jgi:hypothetical protein